MPVASINLPDDGDQFECVAQFAAHVAGFTGEASSGNVKIPLGVQFVDKYDALKITDRPGETLYFVVFAREQQDHYGAADGDEGGDDE